MKALLLLFLLALWRTVAPFAGIGVVARIILFTLLGARFIGAAKFSAAVTHGAWRIGWAQRRW
ncbi:hypothetical protein [Paraburkholderia sp. D1E]|uniref:hypothetical protein n=1 Tax=Paraburkholderia sp. D1E TaxID=3461398 RepID=UPI0040454C4B